ncbi:MAG: PEGA domain-containing protein, partial [Deltaproteobacteria bacterium]|nr:PEGA domain-containing protein [Deltaproteobacteria bacterium]
MASHHEYTPDPGAVVRMPPMPAPPPRSRAPIAAMVAIGMLVALVIGIAIGRATGEEPDTPAVSVASSDRGRLKVLSIPADGNVTLDGRFVGVAPLENLDLDPGKHTIVIDVFGYQPYAGTVEIEPRASAKLTVSLAPLGVA